jgi:hypothetical protein
MGKNKSDYVDVIVHSVMGLDSHGRSKAQIRPIAGQSFDTHLNVECSMKLLENYPIGTRFQIKAKLTDMQGAPFLYSYFGRPYKVIT